VAGIVQGVLFLVVALAPKNPLLGFGWVDRIGFVTVGALIGALLWRFARLAVLVDAGGLVVRNLGGDRRLEWAEVVAVRFGGGEPWVTLDLADGEVLAEMAIQRADGTFGQAEAGRLATLVDRHTATSRDD
jgi:hypothetical protein